ncbi:MAG: hypothetical protein ACOCUS_00050 [Polyangiales bacterium]
MSAHRRRYVPTFPLPEDGAAEWTPGRRGYDPDADEDTERELPDEPPPGYARPEDCR